MQVEEISETSEPTDAAPRSFAARFFGAFRLDASVFEEVEHDASARAQAAAVVTIAGLARAVQVLPEQGILGAVASLVAAWVFWFAVAAAVTAVGVRILRATSDYDEVLRTVGFAGAPLTLLALGVLPLGPLASALTLVAHALAVTALVLAVRQALDVDTTRALAVCAGAIALGLGLLLLLSVVFLGRALA